ncbi:Cytoplasmic polyadenylation element-binding protein 1 [Thelohanellus kitauei]|uniref:Cytoplasmic polyadenylation element-binding protein 1 n=1 Tax=Thelohanellus kitauei TaxID=669202 RepID=A0A0C2NDU3_THEKT|nr:Cytoplasmic polyadenylation element-binding protein 1 [Thelohanellus kitauei]
MMTAETIANIFNELFGGVIYAGIDTDKHKYPIGSGRITFNNYQSYAKAIRARFVEIKTLKFSKRVQIDPYLEDSICSQCSCKQGPFFCREFSCYRYFCNDCWHWAHSHSDMKAHRPVTRQARQNSHFDVSMFSGKSHQLSI